MSCSANKASSDRLLRLIPSPIDCQIKDVSFFAAEDRRRLIVTGEEASLENRNFCRYRRGPGYGLLRTKKTKTKTLNLKTLPRASTNIFTIVYGGSWTGNLPKKSWMSGCVSIPRATDTSDE